MKNLSTIGNYIYGLPFAIFGIMHIMNANNFAAYVPSFFPIKIFLVYLTGLALILAAVSIIINKHVKISTLLLGIMLLIFALTIHLPGVLNPEMMQMSLPSLLKDTSLAGAAFYFSSKSE
ncbi:MAG: DoxX family protein [Ignavibacteria bacterium]|nr:DoxX family protein [Ignavibacteria bacterium]